ncbi:MAG: flagellar motor switch protein FliN [Candidatus Gastranaerophilales bacterium]|nr:flagellar motor switch protein FliN [Candidatus Gastranaerophilales bacterium]
MSESFNQELIGKLKLKNVQMEDLQILLEVLNKTTCDSASIFSMLLNEPAQLLLTDIKEEKNVTAFYKNLGDGVSAEINYEAGINGVCAFNLLTKDALLISNSLMGAKMDEKETKEAEIGELQLSILSETFGQFSTKITENLASVLETKIGALSPAVKVFTAKKPNISSTLAEEEILTVEYDFEIGADYKSKFYQILPLSLVHGICEAYKLAKIPNYEILKNYAEDGGQAQPKSKAYNNETVTVQPVRFSPFDNAPHVTSEGKNLDLLMDIKLKLTVELGRTELPIKKVLELARGSVIELDKIAGEPVELYANGKLIANGEVVVIEDNFGLRITSILSPDNRLKNL